VPAPGSLPSTRLILVRHGETDDNRNQVFQGQLGSGLNDHGRDQAALLAARLARAPRRPAAIVSSDLARARETAEVLGAALGMAPTLDPDLREVFLGAWQGLPSAEIARRFPGEWSAWRSGQDIRRGGGETYAELGDRVSRAMDRAAAVHPGSTVIVVSHGAALKSFVARVLGLGSLGMRAFRVQANTGVSVVERDEEGQRILVWNDEAHLHDALLSLLGGPVIG
jgi:probable phosphoglycerate mutase